MRNKKKQKRILAFLVAMIIIFAGATGALAYLFKTENEKAIALKSELDANTLTVYVASTYISGGDTISADGDNPNVIQQQIRTGLDSMAYISEEELGQTALVDIPEGQPVMYNMVTEQKFDKDTRNYEIAVANLMVTQANNDYVDIRIMFPNGEDYLVLSKKKVMNLYLESNVFTTECNEEEILRFSSAIVDAYTTTGAYIYTTKYIAVDAQEDATPNYPVRAETLELIQSDPNVLTTAINTLNLSARLSLESRLSGLTQEELEAVASGLSLADTAGGTVLQHDTSNEEATELDMDADVDTNEDVDTNADESEEDKND